MNAPDARRGGLQVWAPSVVPPIGVDLSYQPRTQTTLMDFMFPDAAPLTEFSDRYMDGENADELEDGAVFFPGADEDVAI